MELRRSEFWRSSECMGPWRYDFFKDFIKSLGWNQSGPGWGPPPQGGQGGWGPSSGGPSGGWQGGSGPGGPAGGGGKQHY